MSTTAPRTCTTVPFVPTLVAISIYSPAVGSLLAAPAYLPQSLSAGDHFQNLGSDARLAGFVISKIEILKQFFGAIGRVFHRHHLRRPLAGQRFEQRLVYQDIHIPWE